MIPKHCSGRTPMIVEIVCWVKYAGWRKRVMSVRTFQFLIDTVGVNDLSQSFDLSHSIGKILTLVFVFILTIHIWNEGYIGHSILLAPTSPHIDSRKRRRKSCSELYWVAVWVCSFILPFFCFILNSHRPLDFQSFNFTIFRGRNRIYAWLYQRGRK